MRELRDHLAGNGRENASVWDGGQRQHSSQMPFCNGTDTAKAARVSQRKGSPTDEVEKADDGGSVPLVRSTVGNDKSARSKYDGPTGKRSAGKLACSVWSGGKAVRPYLSLSTRIG